MALRSPKTLAAMLRFIVQNAADRAAAPLAEEVSALNDKLDAELSPIRAARSKGGRAPKFNADLQGLVDGLAREHPGATARELFETIPEGRNVDEDSDTLIYRDGEKVVVVDDRTGVEKAIAYETFRTSYVPRARA